MPSLPQPGQCRCPSSSSLQNTTVTSPSTAASVIVTPSSTVRTIVSATTAAAEDVWSDTGLPGTVGDTALTPASSADRGPFQLTDTTSRHGYPPPHLHSI